MLIPARRRAGAQKPVVGEHGAQVAVAEHHAEGLFEAGVHALEAAAVEGVVGGGGVGERGGGGVVAVVPDVVVGGLRGAGLVGHGDFAEEVEGRVG